MSVLQTRLFRRLSPRIIAYLAFGTTILILIYYVSYTSDYKKDESLMTRFGDKDFQKSELKNNLPFETWKNSKLSNGICPKLRQKDVDVNTMDVFKDFEFQPSWMQTKEFWDKSFEDRYERQKMDPERPPLKVVLVPHSHNDPGWLKTFESYFQSSSKQIMTYMVSKLKEHKNLTFIWSEMAFLNAWWEQAHPSKQKALKSLLQEGRIEITTGGWVMTDEANAHVFAMVDQLIEGHQWIYSNLGVKPKAGWSIDPFGHGSTVPYLLAQSGLKGTIIQRIHYAWKQWFALKQYGDFRWAPSWAPSDSSGTILTHNQPFDIYSIKHSCGPHPYVCLSFDFRKVKNEYTEYSVKAQPITDKNIKEKSELLLEQYAKTASLTPHNVALIPLGDDFRYDVAEEWEQQYTNYKKLIDYINSHKDIYKTEIAFGTPSDYFDAINKRFTEFPTLKGDFFVYSDIFSEGRPAYWSGYYTTRPFMKILDRELEHMLRGAEILYTVALNTARQNNLASYKVFERDFERLVRARRNLGLFQHHDAITGTSKAFVMRDYGFKLFEGIRDATSIQQNALQSLLYPTKPIKPHDSVVIIDVERDSYDKLPRKTVITITHEQNRTIGVYNSLTNTLEHVVKILSNSSNILVFDALGNEVDFQISPVWVNLDGNTRFLVSKKEYEVVFVATLPPLSISKFTLVFNKNGVDPSKLSEFYCDSCKDSLVSSSTNEQMPKFVIKPIRTGDIQLGNEKLRLLIDGQTGFLKTVTRTDNPKIMQCGIKFGAYHSAQLHSGAYLFMPDPSDGDNSEFDVLHQYANMRKILITSGPLFSSLTVFYSTFLIHTITIFNNGLTQSNGIHLENMIYFDVPPKNRETEMYMRLISDVQNSEPPEFYSDLNGFQMQKRVKVERIGIEGNYFPITSMAYIQDDQVRLSLLTNHAQGAASYQPGQLEVMLDRRTLYDDSRGLAEGIVDNHQNIQRYWLLIEDMGPRVGDDTLRNTRFDNVDDQFEKEDVLRHFNTQTVPPDTKQELYSTPSMLGNHLANTLNYPPSVFILDAPVTRNVVHLLNKPLPCDVHLLNLRTQPDVTFPQFPSASALLVLHRQGYDCSVRNAYQCVSASDNTTDFSDLSVKHIEIKSLTGLDMIQDNLHKISDAYIEPMALRTLNVTFA